jgi:hypothetical protein
VSVRRFAAGLAAALSALGAPDAFAQVAPAPASSPPAPAASAAAASPVRPFPFYDAHGEKLGPPPTDSPAHRSPFILAASIDLGELVVPDLESAGALVVATIVIGNDVFAGGVGYANLAGTHGLDLQAALGRFGSAARLFDSRGWRGSLMLPDLEAELAWFPGQTNLPNWLLGLKTNVVGFRVAKCFGRTSFELSMSAFTSTMMVEIDRLYFGQTVGARFDVGAAFWR